VGNAKALADAIKLLRGDLALRSQLGKNARAEYEEKYTPEKNYDLLERIYMQAIAKNK
jgi:glycosyltransferase involved in cell wall biosynthesis